MKNLNTILAFYDSLAEQNDAKEYVDNSCLLAAEMGKLLPFVLRRTHDATGLTNVTLKIYDNNANLEQTLTPATFLDLDSGTSYDYLSGKDVNLPANLDNGKSYYLELFDGTKTLYSEKFAVRKAFSDYITLQFSNDTQISNILAGYEQKVYINAVLKTPEYPRIDDAIEKDGIQIYRSQILQKANIIRVMAATEYLVDALMLLPMMDNVTLTVPDTGEIDVQQIEIDDPDWTDVNKGATALLTIKLIEYTIIKKLNFAEMGCTSSTGAEIRQGTVALTSMVEATIVFSSAMTAGYTIDGRLQDASGNSQKVTIPEADITITGFKVTSAVSGTFKWTAIHE